MSDLEITADTTAKPSIAKFLKFLIVSSFIPPITTIGIGISFIIAPSSLIDVSFTFFWYL